MGIGVDIALAAGQPEPTSIRLRRGLAAGAFLFLFVGQPTPTSLYLRSGILPQVDPVVGGGSSVALVGASSITLASGTSTLRGAARCSGTTSITLTCAGTMRGAARMATVVGTIVLTAGGTVTLSDGNVASGWIGRRQRGRR